MSIGFAPLFILHIIVVSLCHGLVLPQEGSNNEFNLAHDKDGDSLLKCEDNKFVGAEETKEFLQNVINYCNGPPQNETEGLNYCTMKAMGMTDEDGVPKLENIEIVIRRILSQEILDKLPEINERFHFCAVDYVESYDEIDYDSEAAAKNYFRCFKKALEGKYRGDDEIFENICD